MRHVFNLHVGDKDQVNMYYARINSLINMNRKPQGRRYSSAAMQVYSRNYRSRGSWKRGQKVSAMPLPSVSKILEYRHQVGEVKAGIDYGVIAKFKDLTADKPEYRRGILVFDEVRRLVLPVYLLRSCFHVHSRSTYVKE
jgi:hypothetical protein